MAPLTDNTGAMPTPAPAWRETRACVRLGWPGVSIMGRPGGMCGNQQVVQDLAISHAVSLTGIIYTYIAIPPAAAAAAAASQHTNCLDVLGPGGRAGGAGRTGQRSGRQHVPPVAINVQMIGDNRPCSHRDHSCRPEVSVPPAARRHLWGELARRPPLQSRHGLEARQALPALRLPPWRGGGCRRTTKCCGGAHGRPQGQACSTTAVGRRRRRRP
jgi:hypothetical protein